MFCSIHFYIRPAISFIKNRNKRRGKIRVGFLCQWIPAWNKLEPIYRSMMNDNLFEFYIICLPSKINNSIYEGSSEELNDTFIWYKERGYVNVVDAFQGGNTWVDIEAMHLDYLFLQRPYGNFLPQQYQVEKLSKYTKICYVSYGMTMTKEIANITLNRGFFKHVYLFFAENEYIKNLNVEQLWISHSLGIQHSMSCGYPGLIPFYEHKCCSDKNKKFTILWTPRWTTDLSLGGTNFFKYCGCFLDYAHRNSDKMDFIFRPHPLMFSNFLKTGEMNESEIENIREEVQKSTNIEFDSNQEYVGTFGRADVLVSDISGIMPEYFVTGKPLVYCRSNMILTPHEFTEKLLKGCYIVDNEEELRKVLNDLVEGKDPLYPIRQEIIKELFGDDIKRSSRRILDALYMYR